MKKKIAIIGAGIAGLTLANFLKKKKDFEFMIYEKNENLLLNNGFGIQLSQNSVSILNQIGFKKIDSENIFQPQKVNFCTIENNKICNLDLTQFNSTDSKYTTLQRSTLLNFLKDEIYTQHLRFAKQIKKISHSQDKIIINFMDGSNDLVDYVVAADGLFSNTRSFFENRIIKPKFKNATVIRSVISLKNIFKIDIENINLLMGSGAHIVIYPINKKNEFNLVCIIRDKEFDLKNIRLIIEKKLFPQNHNLRELFKGELSSWPLYASEKIIPSNNSNVFYLGDAFHGFIPTMAQGASQSIEGSFELYNLLKENNKNSQKLYFKKRSERANLIKKRSNLNFYAFHISHNILKKIRNIILKYIVKNRSFIRNYLGEVYKS